MRMIIAPAPDAGFCIGVRLCYLRVVCQTAASAFVIDAIAIYLHCCSLRLKQRQGLRVRRSWSARHFAVPGICAMHWVGGWAWWGEALSLGDNFGVR